jgi:hypothetical protein
LEKVTLLPKAISTEYELALNPAMIAGGWVIVRVADAVHPAPSVTVTW